MVKNMSRERLQKVLAKITPYSRRKAEDLISAGRVFVNGKIVGALGTTVDPLKDEIRLDGRRLEFSESKVYVLLYKPRGYLCTLNDPQGRPIVTDLIKGIKERIYPVGRLDQDSEGLMMLTNDGDIALKMTHPRYQVKKTYMVLVSSVPTRNQVEALQRGVELEDGMTGPSRRGGDKTAREKVVAANYRIRGKKTTGTPYVRPCGVERGTVKTNGPGKLYPPGTDSRHLSPSPPR